MERESSRASKSPLAVGLLLAVLVFGPLAGRHAAASEGAGFRSDDLLAPLRIDGEMRAWLADALPGSQRAEQIAVLAATLARRGAFTFVDFPEPTPKAVEAFHSRSTNCVGYAVLLVALAREARIPAFFVLIPPRTTTRRGALRSAQAHLAVGVVERGRLAVRDADGPVRGSAARGARPISDLTALAIFRSNRAMEQLAAGPTTEARHHLEMALRLDPDFASGWVNLGVVRRHLGDLDGAETAYRRALDLDPSNRAAQENLDILFDVRGNGPPPPAETIPRDTRNHLALSNLARAERALGRGDLSTARDLYARALVSSSSPTPR